MFLIALNLNHQTQFELSKQKPKKNIFNEASGERTSKVAKSN